MELRQLRYFVEIADQGSFTKAAETLSIAQPALTAQIQKLEAEFSAQLFVRTTRGIVLTEVGLAVREQAQRTLDAAEATTRSAQLAGEVAGARLVVGFTRIFPFLPIARTVRRVRRERPNIKIELREMWSADQMDALGERCDRRRLRALYRRARRSRPHDRSGCGGKRSSRRYPTGIGWQRGARSL